VLGHAAIRRAIHPIKVATGEQVANPVMFKQLLQASAVDIVQVDAARVAGANENLAVLLLAAKHGIPVCPHAGGVGLCEMDDVVVSSKVGRLLVPRIPPVARDDELFDVPGDLTRRRDHSRDGVLRSAGLARRARAGTTSGVGLPGTWNDAPGDSDPVSPPPPRRRQRRSGHAELRGGAAQPRCTRRARTR
jgi:hypothetical protein